jgi:hypothetical protein
MVRSEPKTDDGVAAAAMGEDDPSRTNRMNDSACPIGSKIHIQIPMHAFFVSGQPTTTCTSKEKVAMIDAMT